MRHRANIASETRVPPSNHRSVAKDSSEGSKGSGDVLHTLGFEVTKTEKPKLLFQNGSLKDQVPKQALKYGAPKPSIFQQLAD